METALYILHVLVCIAMLPIILLQSGKGGGVSAVFGGGSSGTVFGSRGASNFLTKMTTGAAIVFMCTSMGLSYLSSQSRSVVPESPDAPVQRPGGGLADEPVDTQPGDEIRAAEPGSGASPSTEGAGSPGKTGGVGAPGGTDGSGASDGSPLEIEIAPPQPAGDAPAD